MPRHNRRMQDTPASGKKLRFAIIAIGFAAALAAAWAGYVAGWWRLGAKTAGPVRITAQPQQIWIEAGDTAQTLNFDFLVENLGPTPLGIDSIEVVAQDAAGKPVVRRFIDSNGFAPSIETVPGRVVAPGAKILVFNPFHTFRPDAPLSRLTYKFSLSIPQEAPDAQATVTVEPRVYEPRTRLSLPVQGKLLIHDGHDYYAHHRRLNTEHPAARELGLARNFMRYSLDINPTDDRFEPFRGAGAKNEDWFAWGQPLYATGDGTVVGAVDSEPDNVRGGTNHFNPQSVKTEPMKFYGNYLVIDHGNGEFSLLGHIQKGSLAVKAGEKVARGQPVARIGSSGSSNNPHLHYELRTGKDLNAEGLPAVFRDFDRHLGSKVLPVSASAVDTGDLLEAR
jgi:murein DD-endopeptidase MepM/ murein hydrolase activator NlpD